MSARRLVKPVLLTLILLMSLVLVYKVHELDRHVDEFRTDIAAVGAQESIPDEEPVTDLGFALQWCNEELGGLSHVERDPCRLECMDYDIDNMILETRMLSESICRSLP
jgi:hypothetical protein